MSKIEPGTYRIVNVGKKTAITVPAEDTSAIVGWDTTNQTVQQLWFVRSYGGKYQISDFLHGRHIVASSATHETKASLGDSPTLWEVLPAEGTTWKIKLPDHDFVLDMYDGKNGSAINVWNQSESSDDNRWKFERLGGLPNDGSEPGRFGTAKEDPIIVQMLEQIAQQGKQLVELAGQLVEQNQRIADQNQKLADQNQKLADQNQKITDQEREVYAQKRQLEDKDRQLEEKDRQLEEKDQQLEEMDQQLEEKDQQLEQANREFKYILARAMREEEPVRKDRITGVSRSSAGEGRARRGNPAARQG